MAESLEMCTRSSIPVRSKRKSGREIKNRGEEVIDHPPETHKALPLTMALEPGGSRNTVTEQGEAGIGAAEYRRDTPASVHSGSDAHVPEGGVLGPLYKRVVGLGDGREGEPGHVLAMIYGGLGHAANHHI